MLEFGFYNMDCMDGMKQFPDKYFDLAIVDPPYNVGASDGSFGRGGLGSKKHAPSPPRKDLKHYKKHSETPNKQYFYELFRISKNQIVWGANYYPEFLTHSGWIIWDKIKDCNPVLSDAELAYQSFNKVTKIFRFQWYGFAKQKGSFESGQTKVIHPNQKPVALYRWLLENYAKPGDKILDTHVGSASSLIACEAMGFQYVGFELDNEYYEAAQKRLADWRSMPLFDNAKNDDGKQLDLAI